MRHADLVSLEKALALLDEAVIPLPRTEHLPLAMAAGRVLARDVRALHSTPPFDRATMDGYAVIVADVQDATPDNPVVLPVIEEIFAGNMPQKTLLPGQTSQIATGARLPKGVESVVMVEDTNRSGNHVSFYKAASPGNYLNNAGSDIKAGDLLLQNGVLLNPAKIGALASQGLTQVEVYTKPIVAIMPTGEEIAMLGQPLKDSQIFDINSHSVAAAVIQNGGEPWMLPITGDNIDHLQYSLEQALNADIVITTGSSSVGVKDYLSDILAKMGDIKYHGISIKPGKPSAFAIVHGKPVLGLPGNPTSCLINTYLLLVPVIRKLAHLPQARNSCINAILAETIRGVESRTLFLPVLLRDGKACNAFKGSGAITSAAHADGYIVVPPDTELPAGHSVSITLF
ncbi:MAG: molybdopterin molybdotransferase MoeA [Dehalococcoidia bacterium]|nr:molybdopterin molybdotransferase MoeA [Dehalococcoidia bacterium]